MEITSGLLGHDISGGNAPYNKTPDKANITRIGKISTSGITEPAGIVVNGPEHSTIMTSSTAANSGTPNDRQCLTMKVPIDMSKQDASYREVGSQYVYWSKPDTSMAIVSRGTFNVEFTTIDPSTSSYRDGTRFWFAIDSAVTDLGAWSGSTNMSDISVAGTFSIVTKDLQQFKQS